MEFLHSKICINLYSKLLNICHFPFHINYQKQTTKNNTTKSLAILVYILYYVSQIIGENQTNVSVFSYIKENVQKPLH